MMRAEDIVPIGEDWFISVAIVNRATGAVMTSLTLTATLKDEAGTTITVPGQGDATSELVYDATDERNEGTIAGLRLTNLDEDEIYYLWLTEPTGKVNRRIPRVAAYHGEI